MEFGEAQLQFASRKPAVFGTATWWVKVGTIDFATPESWLPVANTALILISGAFLALGYGFIRARKVQWHRRSMITAAIFAALFLVVYVARWALLGTKPFAGEGAIRTFYFVILVTHVIVATAVAPFAFVTLRRALRGNFTAHRRIARVTLPGPTPSSPAGSSTGCCTPPCRPP
jgi:putative membrane protein